MGLSPAGGPSPLIRPASFLMGSSAHEFSVLCAGSSTELKLPTGMCSGGIKGQRA